jgi:uncharacterized coiled-coil protein SlyX
MYRTKIEVEIDAQRRLLSQFAAGEPQFLEETQATLKNLEDRLKEVEQAAADPAAFEKSKPPWWDDDQPPRLFGKRAPSAAYGEWSGRPGNSLWVEKDRDEVLKYTRDMGIPGVPFRDWCPNFSKWAVVEVDIDMSVANHFGQADLAAAEIADSVGSKGFTFRGKPTAKSVAEWRKANGYTWHHMKGGKRMQLVPTELHSKIAHEGGAAEARALAGE